MMIIHDDNADEHFDEHLETCFLQKCLEKSLWALGVLVDDSVGFFREAWQQDGAK
jgi:hypothetical protein